MISQPNKIKQVYQELHKFYGGEFSPGELLKQASKFVEFIERANEVEAEFLRSADPDVVGPSVDTALEDGDWKILSRERDWMRQCDDESDFVPDSRLRRRYPTLERSLYSSDGGNLVKGWIIRDEK